ncbi:MAG TPA: hypothetical protein V6C97_23415 [Oculatellaceae cyanobacterium]
MSDVPTNIEKNASTSESITGWVADNVWAPVRDNLLAPVGNVGVQAINATHVTDGVNLVKHATNSLGLTNVADSEKLQPFYVPKAQNSFQRGIQDLSSVAGSIALYGLIAKGTSKALGSSSRMLSSGEAALTLQAEEQTLLQRPMLNTASILKTGSNLAKTLSKEQNALVVGGTLYNTVRDPEAGETRAGNALGALTQFGIFRAANGKFASSLAENPGFMNKAMKVVVPRATVGLTAGLAQDFVSSTVTNSINSKSFKPTFSDNWEHNAGMSAAMNVVLPSLLGGKVRPLTETGDANARTSATGNDAKAATVPTVEPRVTPASAYRFDVVPTAGTIEPASSVAPEGVRAVSEPEPNLNPAATAESMKLKLLPVEQGGDSTQPVVERQLPAVGDKVGRVGGTNPEYPGIDENDAVKRVLPKPDGKVVTIFESGKTVINEPGKGISMRSTEGFVYKVVDGKVIETIPKNAMPPERKPLNVASCAPEDIGKALSNFSERPFTFRGRLYKSVEAWYQGLKWPDDAKRAEIADLSGVEAKRGGRGAPKSDTFVFDGKEYTFGSPEHHALVKDAIKASLEQNPEVRDDFLKTHPRPIIHQTGRPERPGTALPGSKFAKILEDVRQELFDEQNGKSKDAVVPPSGNGSPEVRQVTASDQNVPLADTQSQHATKPVSEIIAGITDPAVTERFNLPAFAEAFKGKNIPTTGYRGVENNALVFEMTDGRVLKVPTRSWEPEYGSRPFDLPVLETGTVDFQGKPLRYVVQPDAPPIDQSQFTPFIHTLMQNGYVFENVDPRRVVTWNGENRLGDPTVVRPMTAAEKAQARRYGFNPPN